MANSVVKEYYDLLEKQQLLGHKCCKCNQITFPPTSSCSNCGSFDYENIVISGKGVVHFISHGMNPPPNPRFTDLAPYAYGLVELSEGIIVYGLITNIKIETEVLEEYYEKCPVAVQADIIKAKGLPILAFKIV
jgi:uncharacterized OB-fold protein